MEIVSGNDLNEANGAYAIANNRFTYLTSFWVRIWAI
jgi:hypothetical protein